MIAGASAAAWGREESRLRWWQHVVAAVGVETPEMRRKRRHVQRCAAGTEGERRTAELLLPLAGEGWHILHDRALPTGKANVDHLLISPAGALLVLDSKMWRRDWPVRLEGGRLMRGPRDETGDAVKAEAIAGRAAAALGLSMRPTCLLVVHNAPVAEGGFHVGDVGVLPADRLLELLRHNAVGQRNPREARRLAERAEVRLPPKVT
uniref:nuclease-related domain-containing protein n=1 Tax=Streptomyces tubercidicus TaxID=47759 RepID=UPI0037DC1E46|nr:NERD domain-containing protein [Streptomyces tubercidicus]